jgi:hypothetical protein
MQKKILLATFFGFLLAAQSHAQINKGAIFLGGDLGFFAQKYQYGSQPDQNTTGINVTPAVGKAISENLILGVDINYGFNRNKTGVNYEQKSSTYGGGVFVRKYQYLGKGFYLFGQGRAGGSYTGYKTIVNNQTPVETKSRQFEISFAIYPGISYTVSKKLQFETGFNNLAFLQLKHADDKPNTGTGSYNTNTISGGTSLSSLSGLVIGFRFLLN